MRRLFALLVLLVFSPIGKADEHALQESIQERSKTLMLQGNLAELDRIANDYRRSDERTPAGLSKLSLFLTAWNVLPTALMAKPGRGP